MIPVNRPTICILGATFTTNNLGVSALAAGTITCLLKRFPDAKLFFLDYARKGFTQSFQFENRTVPVEFVNMRFSKRFYLPHNIAVLLLLSLALKLVPSRKARERLARQNRCLSWLQRADLVVSIAGGDSFSDMYGNERFLYGSLPQVLALLLRKRLILLPQTLGPFRSKFARVIARYIVRRAEVIFSREYLGAQNVEFLAGGETKVRFSYDVAFAVAPRPPVHTSLVGWPQQRVVAPVVGLNVSGLLFMGGYTRDNMFGLRADYRQLAYRVIEFLIREKKAVVLLIPHVLGPPGSESDASVCKALYEELRPKYDTNIAYVNGTYDQSEIKHIIGTCEFFVGSRMHACIAALSQGIPAVAIAYSDKFVGVMQSIGAESLVADARKMSEDDIMRLIDESYENRRYAGLTLAPKMDHVKSQVLELFREIDIAPPRGISIEGQ